MSHFHAPVKMDATPVHNKEILKDGGSLSDLVALHMEYSKDGVVSKINEFEDNQGIESCYISMYPV